MSEINSTNFPAKDLAQLVSENKLPEDEYTSFASIYSRAIQFGQADKLSPLDSAMKTYIANPSAQNLDALQAVADEVHKKITFPKRPGYTLD